ncbi:signal transduction protein containing a membrane domain an EAL and a GGDEF domain-like protein [Shewanella sediminis HAW-EB3]|uniref:cyclic-guanylate-specific phosphodiesterase n=1 Tax=Shewanella sediminis (strain HAW-EB3) TaxID=425104 RepID=A8FYM5_SHESH|nr:EAL domain-containing protein [Shewanella sediminis]ABV37948.1 signal transduction protein containing a membrane domain an EAL and a GGDEF domain-like protein [Shewanella sediminis HAW-EB3]
MDIEKLKHHLRYLALCATLSFVYYLSGRLGLSLAFEQAGVSPVWPPTGIAISAVLIFGFRVWPGIMLGALLVNLSIALPFSAAILIALGNTLEAIVAGYLLIRCAERYPFTQVNHTAWFIAIAVMAPMFSATIGLVSLSMHNLIEASELGIVWSTWWLGDIVGALVIVPLLLTWFRPHESMNGGVPVMALWGTCLVSLGLALLIFSPWHTEYDPHQLLIFMMLPLLIWTALRFHHRGSTLLVTVFSGIAISGTLVGYGPFVMESTNQSLLTLQASVGAIMVTILILIASQEERKRVNRRLLQVQQDLEAKVGQRTHELYTSNKQLAQEVTRQHQLGETLKSLLNATNFTSNDQFLQSCVKDLANAYGAYFAFIGIFSDKTCQSIKTLAVWAGDKVEDNFSYRLRGTPCEDAMNHNVELISSRAALHYPEDKLLNELEVDSYFGAPLVAPSGETIGIIAVMDKKAMDIEEWVKPVLGLFANRVALELQRQSTHKEMEMAASVFKESAEAIVICDSEDKILRVNPAFYKITGYSQIEVVGQSPQLLQSDRPIQSMLHNREAALKKNDIWQCEVSGYRKNGEHFLSWQTVIPVKDENGDTQQIIYIFSDITERKLFEEHIYNLAHHDSLTQLPNRVAFQLQMNTALERAKRSKTQMAVMFIDLDHFKMINDTSGHPVGDLLLQQVAERFKRALRKEDVISRFGGDEFTVLLSNTRTDNATTVVARKLLACFYEPFKLPSSEVVISASIGIGVFPDNGDSVDSLMMNADSAMYRAKEKGRNCFQFYTKEMNQYAQERLELELDLRKALERDEFVLHYQPQFDPNGRIIGCEALIRWQHPDKGLLSPGEFINMAEITGLIVPIGKWVIDTACMQHKMWLSQGYPALNISVNLSGRQFLHHDLLETVKNAITTSGITPSCLELELTESIMMVNVEETIRTLNAISSLGIHMSIDDFGTGYSSMSCLKRFPVNKLKIDQSFVRGLPQDKEDVAIVKSIIVMAHALNLTVIAEGVETLEQLEFLKSSRCEEFQGYYFSRPILAADIEQYLQALADEDVPKVVN